MSTTNNNVSPKTKKIRIFFSLLTAVIAAGAQPSVAGPNDFFGSNLPAGSMPDPNSTGGNVPGSGGAYATPGQAKAQDMLGGTAPSDYTDDEKRMQKKYKASIAHAKGLIAKGDRMMKSTDEKESKKGKVIKDIGEKRLAELEANNPIPHENPQIDTTDKFKEKKAGQ